MRASFVIAALVALCVADPIVGHARAAEPDASCSAPLVAGKRITVKVEGSGPDVVLIPGLSSPRAVWDTTAKRLKGRYRLHLVEVRGFGGGDAGPVLHGTAGPSRPGGMRPCDEVAE